MDHWGWIIAGGAAATGFLATFWSYLRSLWQQLASRVIITCEVRENLAEAISMYCWQQFRSSRFGFRAYTGWSMYVRPKKRVQLIAMEVIGHAGKLYWCGWRPLWLSRIRPGEKNAIQLNGNWQNGGLKLTFLRGTFNIDKLLTAATTEYNRFRAASNGHTRSRYRVRHIFGTANKPATLLGGNNPIEDCGCESQTWDAMSSLHNRVLQWKPDDLGTCRVNHGNALTQHALSSEGEILVEEVRRWKTSEDWYKERGIPWQRGWLLHGDPGTGKTSLVRAVAEDFDLPVFVFDLATLYNNELQAHWQKMLGEVPCIALIEDIDTVFDGRENQVGGHLTFDCLLNCLDGVERTDGILLIVTTNHLNKLDIAFTRPGRLDQIVELRGLNEDGRRQLCRRILKEWPETWEETVTLGNDETGAQFQERCTQMALKHYWRQHD